MTLLLLQINPMKNLLEVEEYNDEFFKIEANKRLPKNILDDEIKEETERVIDLCQKYRKIAKLIQETKIENSDGSKTFRALIPS